MSLGFIIFILITIGFFAGLAIYYRHNIEWFFKHNIEWLKRNWKKVLAGGLALSFLTGGAALLLSGPGPEPEPIPSEPEIWIYPELQPYQIYASPQINWGTFWNVFKNHSAWLLEGWNPSTEEWQNANSLLTVHRDYPTNDTCKLGLEFTTPDNGITTDWRFTLVIDYALKQYANRTGMYEYTLTYENAGNTFNVIFNWSDMLSYSGLQFTHGTKVYNGNNCFWFRVRRDNVPPNFHVDIDPYYQVYGNTITIPDANARCLAMQSNGTLVTIFYQSNTLYVYNSEDEGKTWNELTNVTGMCTSPSMAIDSNDIIHIISDESNLFYTAYVNSTDWNKREIDAELSDNPDIAIDSNDNIHVVYEKPTEGASNDDQVAYINSSDGGRSWSTVQILTNESDVDDDEWWPSIAINSSDSIHVTYQIEDYVAAGASSLAHIYSDDGISWSDWDGDIISNATSTADVYHPTGLVVDDNDVLMTTWLSVPFSLDYIMYAYNDSSGWVNETVLDIVSIPDVLYNPVLALSTFYDYNYIVTEYGRYVSASEWTVNLTYLCNNTTAWSNSINITHWGKDDDSGYMLPNPMRAYYPIINGTHTNMPAAGFCCVYRNGSSNTLSFYKSDDLSFIPPPSEPYVYTFFEAPSNSFGFSSGWIKSINWSYYWSLWENSSDWKLEYTSKLGDSWEDYTGYLIFDKIRTEGLEKQFINFTAPSTGYYRANFTVTGDITNASFNGSHHEYQFSLGIPDSGEVYHVYYNWSDIIHSSWNDYIIYDYGVNDSGLYLEVLITSKISKNSFISLDPVFGNQNTGTTIDRDNLHGTLFTVSVPCEVTTLHAYTTEDGGWKGASAVALYNDDATLVVGSSMYEYDVTSNGWDTYDVVDTVIGAGDYYIVFAGELASGKHIGLDYSATSCTCAIDTGNNVNSIWPDPWAQTNDGNNYCYSLYATYTAVTPNQTGEIPIDDATGQVLNPTLQITVDDPNDDYLFATWHTNETGTWESFAYNNSVNTGSGAANIEQTDYTNYYWSDADRLLGTDIDVTGAAGGENGIFCYIKAISNVTGRLDNISVDINSGWTSGEKLKCLIYDDDGYLVAETEEKDEGGGGWIVFNFTNYSPIIYAGVNYSVGLFIDSEVLLEYGLTDYNDWYGGRLKESMTYPTPENPLDSPDSADWDNSYVIYANTSEILFSGFTAYNKTYWWSMNVTDGTYWSNGTYSFTTEMMIPEIELVTPANSSTGVSISPTCEVKVFDNSTNAEGLTVEWYENTTTQYSEYLCDDSDGEGWEGYNVQYGSLLGGTEFVSANYSSISVDDDNYVFHQASTGSRYQYHRFYSYIAEETFQIEKINITWRGYGGDTDPSYGCSLFVYNFTSNNWVKFDSHSSSSKANLFMEIVGNVTDFVNNNEIRYGVMSDKNGGISDYSWIYSYYTIVNITKKWNLQQTNNSVSSGDTVSWTYTNASEASTQYWWKAVVNNSQFSNESWYTFTTASGGGPVTYNTTIRTAGVDYYIWLGENLSAYQIATEMNNSASITWSDGEYIAIWNSSGTWSEPNAAFARNGTWYEYHVWNGSGFNWTITTCDIIKVYITDDSGDVTVNMTGNSGFPYTSDRTVYLINATKNRGGNFTGYTDNADTTLSSIATATSMASGEALWLWNETNYDWDGYVVGFGGTDAAVHEDDVVFTKIEATRTWTIGGK